MAVQIIFETHAISGDNEAGVATGWLPGTLSPRGRELARALGKRHTEAIAAVFVSDLARAVQTAELAFGDRGIPIRLDARLRECDYGERNGMPVAGLAAERSQHIDRPWRGGQSYRQVVAQVSDFLRDLSAGWEGRTVVVIGHSATRWALDCLLDGATLGELVDAPFGWQEGWHYQLPPAWRAEVTAEPPAGLGGCRRRDDGWRYAGGHAEGDRDSRVGHGTTGNLLSWWGGSGILGP